MKSKCINAKKGKPLLVVERLREYGENSGDYNINPIWRIGYLCACRDAGLLTWDQWLDLVKEERDKLYV